MLIENINIIRPLINVMALILLFIQIKTENPIFTIPIFILLMIQLSI